MIFHVASRMSRDLEYNIPIHAFRFKERTNDDSCEYNDDDEDKHD